MGDDDGGSVLGDMIESGLDVALRLSIESRGRFVQKQDRRRLELWKMKNRKVRRTKYMRPELTKTTPN